MESGDSLIATEPNRRGFTLGIVASLAIHCAAAALLRASTSGGAPEGSGDPILLTDIDIPPEPPEAHDPSEEEALPPVVALEPEPEPAPAATIEPLPEPEPEPDEVVELVVDAGAPDAGVELATAEPDAGVGPDAAAEVAGAEADAGVGEPELARVGGDAGSDVVHALAGADLDAGWAAEDGGARIASAETDPDTAAAGASTPSRGPVPSWVEGPAPTSTASGPGGAGEGDGVAAPPGAGSNLLAYFPEGELVTVLLRLDRFRATQWAQRMEAVVRPMPDYQAIVGSRNVMFSDLFDTLVISSPRPQDVAATTLVGRYGGSDAKVRRFLNHREARVRWRSGRGGAVGHRLRSQLVLKHDRRVFLIPYPGMVILAPPGYFGPLLESSRAPLGATRAEDAEAPDWLERVRAIELESGTETGPAVLLTMVGFPRRFDIPLVGAVPGPERATLALEITTGGFLVRGNLLFSAEKQAAEFVAFADEKQKWLVGTVRGRLLLAPFHAFNALKGLSLKRRGKKVAYATSISVADGRAMLDYAAQWTAAFFPSLLPEPGPKNGVGPSRGGREPGKSSAKPIPTPAKPERTPANP